MWSRVVEIMLGVWLVISPFIFAHPHSQPEWWVNDIAAGTVVILAGLFSFWTPTRLAHLVTLITACWLIGFAYYHGFGEAAAALQNNLILGVMLLMFAVIPNHSSRPPRSWDAKRLT